MAILLIILGTWGGYQAFPGPKDDGLRASASRQDSPLHLGVLGRDGVAIPVAVYREGAWAKAWPEPIIDRDPAPAPTEVPSRWYAYVGGAAAVRVQFRDRVITEAHCALNWAYTTDWSAQVPRERGTVRQIAGMILSDSLPLVEERAIAGLADFRERFGLVGEETYRRDTALGYFHRGGRLFGVFLRLSYEQERYQIYEVESGGGRLVVDVDGGGC